MTLGNRYGSNTLIDMRIHDIGVVADLNSHDPTTPDPTAPVECDGTGDGKAEAHSDGAQVHFEAKLGEADGMISLYWTGWWPTLHFAIQRELVTDVVLSIHLTVDILGSVGIETFNVEVLGVQEMTEPECDEYVREIRPACSSMVGTGSPWAYFIGIGGAMYTAAMIAALFAPPGSAQIELLIMGMLGVATTLICLGLMLLAQAVAQNLTDPLLVAITFIGAALTAILAIATSKYIIDSWGGKSTGAAKYFRFWGEQYQNGNRWDEIGLKGRTHWMVMFTQILILSTVVLITIGFIAGWIYDVFL